MSDICLARGWAARCVTSPCARARTRGPCRTPKPNARAKRVAEQRLCKPENRALFPVKRLFSGPLGPRHPPLAPSAGRCSVLFIDGKVRQHRTISGPSPRSRPGAGPFAEGRLRRPESPPQRPSNAIARAHKAPAAARLRRARGRDQRPAARPGGRRARGRRGARGPTRNRSRTDREPTENRPATPRLPPGYRPATGTRARPGEGQAKAR